MKLYKNILLVFEAINHRTIHARKYPDTEQLYKNMNFAVLQTLYALDIINYTQYELLYQKISTLECLTINDVYNINTENNKKGWLYMGFRYGTYYYSLIGHLIETDKSELLRLMEDWIKYNNPNLNNAVEYILEYGVKLPNEFFDRFIMLLDNYNKTEYALLCVRKLSERKEKEKFILWKTYITI